MRTTRQFRIFSGEPTERALARPRHLLREGRTVDAEAAYRSVLEEQPGLRPAWMEYFQLLRSHRRFGEALELAQRAAEEIEDEALALALRGAALVELGRYREGLSALESAAVHAPDLALVWHEIGYAAFRLGEHSRALLALDRAFALEPHSATLLLRGEILRAAGRYLAAEVAFGGAAEAAEYPEQRVDAERQIASTRRYASFGAQRPEALPASRRWFADTGAVLLCAEGSNSSPSDEELAAGLAALVDRLGWRFSILITTEPLPLWKTLAARLRVPGSDRLDLAGDPIPLVVSVTANAGEAWERCLRQIASLGRGLSFALQQPAEGPAADVVGLLESEARSALDLERAALMADHPEGRLRSRVLRGP